MNRQSADGSHALSCHDPPLLTNLADQTLVASQTSIVRHVPHTRLALWHLQAIIRVAGAPDRTFMHNSRQDALVITGNAVVVWAQNAPCPGIRRVLALAAGLATGFVVRELEPARLMAPTSRVLTPVEAGFYKDVALGTAIHALFALYARRPGDQPVVPRSSAQTLVHRYNTC